MFKSLVSLAFFSAVAGYSFAFTLGAESWNTTFVGLAAWVISGSVVTVNILNLKSAASDAVYLKDTGTH